MLLTIETRILLMDDDDIGNFLSEMESTKIDFNAIISVTDDKQALGNLKKENCPNLVFLDFNMPVIDGFSFLVRALKEISRM